MRDISIDINTYVSFFFFVFKIYGVTFILFSCFKRSQDHRQKFWMEISASSNEKRAGYVYDTSKNKA